MDPQIRSEMRHIFKAITKNDRNARASAVVDRVGFVAHARDLQHALRAFHNKLSELQMQLLGRNISETPPNELKAKVHELLAINAQNYAGVLELGQRFRSEDCEGASSSCRTSDSPLRNKGSYAAALEGTQKSTGNKDEATASAADDGAVDKKGRCCYRLKVNIFKFCGFTFSWHNQQSGRAETQRLRRVCLEACTHEAGRSRSRLKSTLYYCRAS